MPRWRHQLSKPFDWLQPGNSVPQWLLPAGFQGGVLHFFINKVPVLISSRTQYEHFKTVRWDYGLQKNGWLPENLNLFVAHIIKLGNILGGRYRDFNDIRKIPKLSSMFVLPLYSKFSLCSSPPLMAQQMHVLPLLFIYLPLCLSTYMDVWIICMSILYVLLITIMWVYESSSYIFYLVQSKDNLVITWFGCLSYLSRE